MKKVGIVLFNSDVTIVGDAKGDPTVILGEKLLMKN